MRRAALGFFLFWIANGSPAAVDPATAVQTAREQIAAKQFGEALEALRGALESASALAEPERSQAISAIHFYSAVACSGARKDAEARKHLAVYFEMVPTARLSAPEKYERRFVELFNDLRPRGDEATLHFESFYPGFHTFSVPPGDDPNVETSLAVAILATRREKQQWNSILDSAERARFAADFWKRRDPSPDTERNEFRERFELRAAFADHAFDSSGDRGALTDRGKVFVLLGEPSSVRRRPLTEHDPVVVYSGPTIINGMVEQWVYASERLPIHLARKMVAFRFITQQGIGDGVLQQEDIFAFQALTAATNPNEQP